jgi:gag-polyprotein putative aspartyl protease
LKLSFTPLELQQDGPRIFISISTTAFELKEGRAVGLEFPEPVQITALLDTGASITVINPQLAQTCKLRQTGFAELLAAGSSGRYPEHAAAISFPRYGLKSLEVIKVVACPIVRQPYSCLIGRDIMSRWELSYDGVRGKVAITE